MQELLSIENSLESKTSSFPQTNTIKRDKLFIENIGLVGDWHSFPGEKRWFRSLKGDFIVLIVQLDDWENPSHDLTVQESTISSEKSDNLIFLPSGYAINFKAIQNKSLLEIISDTGKEEASSNKLTYEKSRWYFDSFF